MKKILLYSFCVWLASMVAMFVLLFNAGKIQPDSVLLHIVGYISVAATLIMIPSGIFTGLRYLYSNQTSTFSKIFWTLWIICTVTSMVLLNIKATRDSQLYVSFMLASSFCLVFIIFRQIARSMRYDYYIDD